MGKKGRICATCTDSRTPALSAAMLGHVECLHEAYKSLNVLNERDKFGATPVHYAARHGQIECLQWLVEYSNVSPNAAARNGSTPAHDAAATGNIDCLRFLIENTKCSAQERTIEGATVLHMACRFGRIDVVRWLIDNAGASPSDKGANEVTPVHLCAAKNNIACLKWLTNHSDYKANQATSHGATPVYFAAQEGSLKCLQWLVSEGNGDVFTCAKDGMYALHAAAQAGQFECLKYLIEEQGMSVRLRSSDGATAVHFSAAGGHVKCLSWLLDLDEDLATVRDNLGGTPMHDAAEEGQSASLEEFIRRGVNLEVHDYDHVTPLHLAEEGNHDDCVAILRAYKEANAHTTKAPKVFVPINEEEEEDLKQKELEEQQRRRLAAAMIQEEEQKLEEWRKKQEQTLSLGEQLHKLKELSQSEDEERVDLSHLSRSVLVARQGSKRIQQTEIKVQEALITTQANTSNHIIDLTSQLAVQTADTAEVGYHSKSTSPIPNGHGPSQLSSQETSPIILSRELSPEPLDVPVQRSDAFSDSEDHYRRGMSGRRKKSLLALFRIKKKKKKPTDQNKKKKNSIQSDTFSDSDLDTNSVSETNKKRSRWRLFRSRSPKPSTSPVQEEPVETQIEENSEDVKVVRTAVHSTEYPQTSRKVSVASNGPQIETSRAGGGEWVLVQSHGSAEIRRRRSVEQSAREHMKEASKMVAAIRKANQEKRKISCPEEDDAQQKEDEEDRERVKKMSHTREPLSLPSITAEKKQKAFEDAIFTTWKSGVEPFPSTRLVQEDLTNELKVQQRHSTEIVLREGETTTDEEREDAAKWAKGGLSPTDEESDDDDDNTEWHPELTSTLPKKRSNLSSALSSAGRWERDGSQVPRCNEDTAEYIQVTDAKEHIYDEPSLVLEDREAEHDETTEVEANTTEPLYVEPNDEEISIVKRSFTMVNSTEIIHSQTDDDMPNRNVLHLQVGDDSTKNDDSGSREQSQSQSLGSTNKILGESSGMAMKQNIIIKVSLPDNKEYSDNDSKSESVELRRKAEKMAERHSVDLDQSLHEVTMQRDFEHRLIVAEETRRQLKEKQQRHSAVLAAAAEDEDKARREEESKVLDAVKAEKDEEKQQKDEFQKRKDEAAKRRTEKEEKAEKERTLEKGVNGSPDIEGMVARKQQEDNQIRCKLSQSPDKLLADIDQMLDTDVDAWDRLRRDEEKRVKIKIDKQMIKAAALRRLSRGISPGAVSRDSTMSKEERAMEAAFSALNDSFADIGLGKAMIEKAVIEYDIPILEDKREVSRDQELSEDEELDLDLLLADLDKAITLATERTASGTVEQEIAYASGTRNRKKSAASSHCSTPQYTPQKSRTPRLTPGQTPGSSKGGTPSAQDMRNQLRRLVLDGQRQEESLKRKKSSRFSNRKKKAEKSDSKPTLIENVTVYDDDGRAYSVPLGKTMMTIKILTHKVAEQSGQKLVPTLSIIESFQDLHLERCLEDHELVEEVVQFWHGNKAVRLIVRDVPTKYKLWEKPQLPRDVLIKFCDYGVVPDLSGPLYEKDNRKKVWKERLFVLQEDGIMGAATQGSMDKRHLVVVASLRNHNIYTAFGDDKANRGPTPYCLFLKPHNSVVRTEVISLCAPNVDTMNSWIAASRLVKFGPRLKEDYLTMRHQFAAFIKTQEGSSLHY